jgi:hypothetical protein
VGEEGTERGREGGGKMGEGLYGPRQQIPKDTTGSNLSEDADSNQRHSSLAPYCSSKVMLDEQSNERTVGIIHYLCCTNLYRSKSD